MCVGKISPPIKGPPPSAFPVQPFSQLWYEVFASTCPSTTRGDHSTGLGLISIALQPALGCFGDRRTLVKDHINGRTTLQTR